jgi:hypothetical protein
MPAFRLRLLVSLAIAICGAGIASVIAQYANRHMAVSAATTVVVYIGLIATIYTGCWVSTRCNWEASLQMLVLIVVGVAMASLLVPSESLTRNMRDDRVAQQTRLSRGIDYAVVGGACGAIIAIVFVLSARRKR